MELYPLKFKTIFKDKIWGGEKIRTVLKKDFSPLKNCGETWEISGVAGNISEVESGSLAGKSLTELIGEYKGDLVGQKVYAQSGTEFPLLVKFIDANEDLSIQVHPDDALAQKRHNSLGKTEMWYIIQADAGAKLISGFNQEITKESYLQHLTDNKLAAILNEETVFAGDVFFLPAGRVHTIGKGLLLAEIQQSSDITYRIYDFDRVDDAGNKRQLHTEEALDAIDYAYYPEYKTAYKSQKNELVQVVNSNYFTTNILDINQPLTRNYGNFDSFVILVCLEGEATLRYNSGEIYVRAGDSILVPAKLKEVTLLPQPDFKALESYI